MKTILLICVALIGFAVASAAQTPYGNNGFNYVTDTNVVTGNWYCIDVLEEAAIDTIKVRNRTGANTTVIQTITADTIPAGARLFWNITRLKLNSGKVVLYRKID